MKKEAAKKKIPETQPEPKGKKKEEPAYRVRKNTGAKVLRAVFWFMLIFIFIRGVTSVLAPNQHEETEQMIADFKAEYSTFSNQNAEAMAFAQNFAKEYLTYKEKGEQEYKIRIQPYVTTTFLNAGKWVDFKAAATVTYAEAYRVESYSKNQLDVYVLVDVEYSNRYLLEDGQTYTTEITNRQVVLKVPVYTENELYVVENIPLMVNDSNYIEKYKISDYSGTALSDTTTNAIETSVTNFLKAYFEQDENVINYYLAENADKDSFIGLDGRFTFQKIENIRCYREEGSDIIVCLAEFKIKDGENGAVMLQKINLSILENGGKYYIESMNTRTGNLNLN